MLIDITKVLHQKIESYKINKSASLILSFIIRKENLSPGSEFFFC